MNNTPFNDVPHLANELSAPFDQFVEVLRTESDAVENWFAEQFSVTNAPFYASADLRHAGFKLSPVDTNLFPAGFNNLGESTYSNAAIAIKSTLAKLAPKTSRILLLAESHSRNSMYFENLSCLQKIIQHADLDVRVGVILPELKQPRVIETPSGSQITIEPVSEENKVLSIADFTPDIILLNSDLSEGIPDLLVGLSQPVLPAPQLGWSTRLKSSHFQHVTNVANEFAKTFEVDPWAIAPLFHYCGEINFMTREGEDCLVRHAENLFAQVERKYKEYQIKHDPFLVIKADAGTYGMAVMSIRSPEDIRQLNRKQRQRMSAAKGGRSVTRAIVQEGVHTFETWGQNESSAEPVLYMVGDTVIGCFYRVHSERGIDQNLNAPGMQFEAFNCKEKQDENSVRCYSYSVVARLALIAAAREMKEVLDVS